MTFTLVLLHILQNISDILCDHCISLAVLLITTLYIFYRTVIYPLYLSPLRHIPGPPLFSSSGSMLSFFFGPLNGQFPAILSGEAGIPQREWFKRYGDERGVIRVVGPVGIERLIFLNPSAYERMMVKRSQIYPRPQFVREALRLCIGNGLLSTEDAEHTNLRKVFNPAFALSNLVLQVDKYHDAIGSLVDILKRQIQSSETPILGVVLPVSQWMSKLTLDIICAVAFSYYPDVLHDSESELETAWERIMELQNGQNLATLFVFTMLPGFTSFMKTEIVWRIRNVIKYIPPFGRELSTIIDSTHIIRLISKDILKRVREDYATGAEGDRKDFISIFATAQEEDLASNNEEVLLDLVSSFLATGYETTASGLSWTLYLLAANKEAQDKLRREVVPVLANNPRPGYKTLQDLVWLDCVVKESLRVLPPVPLTLRQASATDYIDGILVPKGTFICIPIRITNTWKAIWGPDAEKFHPERWLNLPRDLDAGRTFQTFLSGHRGCIGKTMGIMGMKATLAALIANFEFDLAYEGQLPRTTTAITMIARDKMPLRVRLVIPKSVSGSSDPKATD